MSSIVSPASARASGGLAREPGLADVEPATGVNRLSRADDGDRRHARSSATTQWFCIPSPPVPWTRPRLAAVEHGLRRPVPGPPRAAGRARSPSPGRRQCAPEGFRTTSPAYASSRALLARPRASTTISSPTVEPADTSTMSKSPAPSSPPSGTRSRCGRAAGSDGLARREEVLVDRRAHAVTHPTPADLAATCAVPSTTATAPSTGRDRSRSVRGARPRSSTGPR